MGEIFAPIKQEVLAIIAKYKAAGAPKGFLAIFMFLYSVTGDLMELVEASGKIVKAAKKETVIEAMKFIYYDINPDLPWVPEPFETKLESWFLDSAVPAFIDFLVNKYNEKGIFKK